MDKLSQDSTNAIKAGMSYGQYMAMKQPVKVEQHEPQGIRRICEHCGEIFYRYDQIKQKYCSDRCRKNAENKRARKPAKPVARTCPICGKEFMAASWRNKYCGPFCTKVAGTERVKAYQKRLSEKEAAADA